MKKLLSALLTSILAFVLAFSAVACGGGNDSGTSTGGDSSSNGGASSSGGGTKKNVTIEFYTTVNIVEKNALQAVADAYSDYKYNTEGVNVEVILDNNDNPATYMDNVRKMAEDGVSAPTIVMTSVASEYYGSNKFVDLSEYLEDVNPYMSGKTVWKDGLEADAYRTQVSGSTMTIPGLSYSSNYLTVYYNKNAVKTILKGDSAVGADGTIDQTKITWSWLINALKKAKDSDSRFATPFGLSKSEQSCGEGSFNMLSHLVNMYLDQYYRDFTQKVHSENGDYSYNEEIDPDWTYNAEDAGNDAVDKYSYNLNKVVDLFFNQEGYNPTSARYAEVMQNLYELMSYADNTASYNDTFNFFNNTTSVFEGKDASYKNLRLFYVEALDYVRTYRDAFKTQSGGKVTYASAEQISKELGWFLMPAMEPSAEALAAGATTNVRAFGGPQENYGIVNSGNSETTAEAIDFLMYLFSPTGQNAIYSSYKAANNAPITMRQLVKNVDIPKAIDYAIIKAEGDCTTAPYLVFGKCSGMNTATVNGTIETVSSKVAKSMSNYFKGRTSTWDGTETFRAIKDGFKSYSEDKNFIYNDYTQVSSKTNGLKNSPFKTSN